MTATAGAAAAAAPLTIWVDSKRPCAYSSAAETILYRPPGVLEHLTLGDGTPKAPKGVDAKKDDDLGPVIELVSGIDELVISERLSRVPSHPSGSLLTHSTAQPRHGRAGPPVPARPREAEAHAVLWLGP